MELKEIVNKERLLAQHDRYAKVLDRIAADVPIEVLCLPKTIYTILLRAGCRRVCDVLNLDLAKVKGIGKTRQAFLIEVINNFIGM